jgi:hypothetical protein
LAPPPPINPPIAEVTTGIKPPPAALVGLAPPPPVNPPTAEVTTGTTPPPTAEVTTGTTPPTAEVTTGTTPPPTAEVTTGTTPPPTAEVTTGTTPPPTAEVTTGITPPPAALVGFAPPPPTTEVRPPPGRLDETVTVGTAPGTPFGNRILRIEAGRLRIGNREAMSVPLRRLIGTLTVFPLRAETQLKFRMFCECDH